MMRRIKKKKAFGMLWVMGALGERKKKKEILRQYGMVLD